ncbi:MAG: hypothetical protein V4550_01570 [Gemmatimonadota bacterium]
MSAIIEIDTDHGVIPSASARVEMISAYSDERGSLQTLINCQTNNVALISSAKGTVRSNHYHKTDWHYMYMISGAADYLFRPAGSTEEPQHLLFKKGDLLYTGPMEEHATVFLEDSVLLAMSGHPRDQDTYEGDIVRVVLVTPEEAMERAARH